MKMKEKIARVLDKLLKWKVYRIVDASYASNSEDFRVPEKSGALSSLLIFFRNKL